MFKSGRMSLRELKLTFNDGGHELFREKFQTMKERLDYARQLQRETGQVIPTGEDLPRYEANTPTNAAPAGAAGQSSATGSQNTGTGAQQSSQPTPQEPPPDYEEAQAQAVGIRLEEQLREAAERQG